MSKRTPRGGSTTHQRRSGRVRLHATSPAPSLTPDPPSPLVGWFLAATGGGLIAAAAAWIIVTGLAVIGWLPGDGAPLSSVFGFGTDLWLLGHGATVMLAGLPVNLIPLGLSVLSWLTVRGCATLAARQAALAVEDNTWSGRARLVGRVGGLLVATYVVIVSVVALVSGAVSLRLLIGTVVLAGTAGLVGATRGAGLDLMELLPAWARAIPRAVLASQLVIFAGAAAALTTALVLNRGAAGDLEAQIVSGAGGAVGLTALQLAYVPTLLVWTVAWILGPGFSLGLGSLVSPADTHLGLLPAVPITAALPPEGPGLTVSFSWLAVGILAGAVAAAITVRSRPRARFDETALVGGLAGALSGLVVPLVALAARGDFGAGRLVDLGPQVLELLIIAPALLGIPGMAVGLVWGLIRRPG